MKRPIFPIPKSHKSKTNKRFYELRRTHTRHIAIAFASNSSRCYRSCKNYQIECATTNVWASPSVVACFALCERKTAIGESVSNKRPNHLKNEQVSGMNFNIVFQHARRGAACVWLELGYVCIGTSGKKLLNFNFGEALTREFIWGVCVVAFIGCYGHLSIVN